MKGGILPGDRPLVTVIIPTRNEEQHIGRCLDSVLKNDYPRSRMEILIVDGMSEDRTREIIGEYAQKNDCIKLIDNPHLFTPHALNLGVRNARGEIVVTFGAHTTYSSNYLSTVVRYLKSGEADCVGSVAETRSEGGSLTGEAIATALSCSFGVGNSHMRTGVKTPRFVDTASCPGYRKEIFERIGLFDEELVRNQDDEFNSRLRKSGGKVLLVPDIVSYYTSRNSIKKLSRMMYQYGYFKVRVAQKLGGVYTFRQLAPPVLVASFFLTSGLTLLPYAAANLAVSLKLSLRKRLMLFFVLPLVFAATHFSYGLGYLKGIWDFVFRRSHLKRRRQHVPLTR
jgi:glycosyltransferase involved in cell wall biosynthesis